MNDSSKGQYYIIFKENLEYEKYLDYLSNSDRYVLCIFRTGNHKLIIETGRWENIERTERICNLCNNHSIGDEFHYFCLRMSCINWRSKKLFMSILLLALQYFEI